MSTVENINAARAAIVLALKDYHGEAREHLHRAKLELALAQDIIIDEGGDDKAAPDDYMHYKKSE